MLIVIINSMKLKKSRIFIYVLAFVGCASFIGCGQKVDIPEPIELPRAFSETGIAPTERQWWTAFESGEINRINQMALEENFSLAEAFQRLQAAKAVARKARSSFWPSLSLEASGRTQEPDLPSGDEFTLGASASYEIDLWGRIRSLAQAKQLEAKASHLDYQTAVITLSAQVTGTWFRWVVAQKQEELLRKQLEANRTVLELLQNRFNRGQVLRVDLLRQQRLIEGVIGQLSEAESRTQLLNHELAILLGQKPDFILPQQALELPRIPPLPATGIPAELIQRRPDVLAAFYRIQSADRETAAAIANRFPRLTLTASITTEENNSVNFFDDWVKGLAGNLVAPVFDGGSRRAEVNRTQAVRLQRIYNYSNIVINALKEVEDALIQERTQDQVLNNLRKQLQLSNESLMQLRNQYFNGVSNYIDVLTSILEQQRLERDVLDAQLDLYQTRVELYRSLAGSLDHEGLNPLNN